uniref:DUF4772 domain-containing protein n=1 Tax=Glossina brevipalpis TaxID=37001 RepID=A0A1A9WEK3_9MUSC
MSTGRRLAKRSIIGTKVCAPGPDGLWYSGVIQDVKTPPTATLTRLPDDTDAETAETTLNETKYIVRFDFKTQSTETVINGNSNLSMRNRNVNLRDISPAQTLRRNAMIKEFGESELIGPGFRSIIGVHLQPGQRVYVTYNGRETSGDIVQHDTAKDEVTIKITPIGLEHLRGKQLHMPNCNLTVVPQQFLTVCFNKFLANVGSSQLLKSTTVTTSTITIANAIVLQLLTLPVGFSKSLLRILAVRVNVMNCGLKLGMEPK